MKEPVPMGILANIIDVYRSYEYLSYLLFQGKFGTCTSYSQVVDQKSAEEGIEAWIEDNNLNIIIWVDNVELYME